MVELAESIYFALEHLATHPVLEGFDINDLDSYDLTGFFVDPFVHKTAITLAYHI